MKLPVPISLETSENQLISIQEQANDGPMLYVLVFFMVLVFFSGICWIFCCGTCVGRDTLKVFGFGRFLPPNYNSRGRRSLVRGMRNYKYSPAATEEEEWEMMEEGVDENNVRVADEENDSLQ